MHMIAPVSAGTLTGVSDRNSIHTIPASAAGSAVMMMNGSSQDWKLTTIKRYTSTIAAASPSRRPANESVMVRSEEHTSELQSPCNLVCRLLLEKKKK